MENAHMIRKQTNNRSTRLLLLMYRNMYMYFYVRFHVF